MIFVLTAQTFYFVCLISITKVHWNNIYEVNRREICCTTYLYFENVYLHSVLQHFIPVLLHSTSVLPLHENLHFVLE